jgi:phospholipid/cholesterol/gamma-HCH transport system substrate-binding protein
MNDEPAASPRTSESLELRAALLVGLLVLLVAASAAYLLYARGVFQPSQRLVLIADDAEGVTVGMDLTFSGFPIGRVRKIELTADGVTHIMIDVPRKDARWLRESSVFTLTRGLVGIQPARIQRRVTDPSPTAPSARYWSVMPPRKFRVSCRNARTDSQSVTAHVGRLGAGDDAGERAERDREDEGAARRTRTAFRQ